MNAWVNYPSKIVYIYIGFLSGTLSKHTKMWTHYKKDDIISGNILMSYSHVLFCGIFLIDMTFPYQNS